jgi:hypothetical protein
METLSPTQVEALHRKNGVTGLIYNYVMATYNITKFLRSIYKVDTEPRVKKVPYNPPKPKPETRIMTEEDMSLLVSKKQNTFKVKLHSDIYNENLANSFANMKKEKQIMDVEKRIKQLKALKNSLKFKEEKDIKQKKAEEKKRDEMEYRKYTEELRKMAIGIIEEQLREDREHKMERNFNLIKEQRLKKMKEELFHKMHQIDEFKANLEESEWKQLQLKEMEHEKIEAHEEFVKKLQEEKIFKQLLYAAEKKLEQEERKRKREEQLKFKHQKLLDEQEALEDELFMLQQMYA